MRAWGPRWCRTGPTGDVVRPQDPQARRHTAPWLSYSEGMQAPSLLHSGAGLSKTHDRMAQVAVRCDVRCLRRGTRGEATHGARVGTREYRTTCRYGAGPGPRPCRGDPAGGRV